MIIKFKNDRKFHIRPKFQIKEIKKKKIFFHFKFGYKKILFIFEEW